MSERLQTTEIEELIVRYPKLLVIRNSDDEYTRQVATIRCGSGWQAIINCLLTSIQRYTDYSNQYTDTSVEQIKISVITEKAGSLRVYYNGVADDRIDAMIAVTIEISKTICEISGQAGKTYAKNGWFKTLSPEIAAMLGYELDQRVSDSVLGAGTEATDLG